MIVVVEGPSAAGKTTWVRAHHAEHEVAEYRAADGDPEPGPDAHPEEQARYWAEVAARRWRLARIEEDRSGLAVCDSDPFKLHYAWGLWRIGKLAPVAWYAQARAYRRAFMTGRLGLADLTLVTIPFEAVLRERAGADPDRERSGLELHLRLAEPLRAWYEALATLDPDRVRWALPDGGLDGASLPPPRPKRSDDALFNALMNALPAT